MKVHFIEESRFYPLRDIGNQRQPVWPGDLVSFHFPHDDKCGVGLVTRVYECNGRRCHDLEQLKGKPVA